MYGQRGGIVIGVPPFVCMSQHKAGRAFPQKTGKPPGNLRRVCGRFLIRDAKIDKFGASSSLFERAEEFIAARCGIVFATRETVPVAAASTCYAARHR